MTTDVGSLQELPTQRRKDYARVESSISYRRVRAEIDLLFDGSRDLVEVIEDVARLDARLIIQTAAEAEVEVFLGRAHYQRVAGVEDARPGMRNGYCPTTIKTTGRIRARSTLTPAHADLMPPPTYSPMGRPLRGAPGNCVRGAGHGSPSLLEPTASGRVRTDRSARQLGHALDQLSRTLVCPGFSGLDRGERGAAWWFGM